jgi:hypothetical protein
MLKRHQWKILNKIYIDYNNRTCLQKLSTDASWESWKAEVVDKLLKEKYLKYIDISDNVPELSIFKITFKGRWVIFAYSNRFSDKKFSVSKKKAVKFLSSNIVDKDSVTIINNTKTANDIKVLGLWILVLFVVFCFFWEMLVNHNKVVAVIWLLICIFLSVIKFSRYR